MSDDCLPERGPLPPKPFQFSLRAMLIGVAVFALLLGLAVPAFRAAREEALRSQCSNNLKQIALALHDYHDVWKCFPPARTLGPDGKTWHSWRMLLVPFIEAKPLYEQYQKDEPWNGPNNKNLHGTPWSIFRCPGAPWRDRYTTSYLAVVGPETAWPGADSGDFAHLTDGLSRTILVVEVANSDIHWMEPRDLEFNDLFGSTAAGGKLKPSSHHPGGFNVLFGDGSVRWLPEDVARQKLREMLTRNGGESVDLDEWSD
jgi:prepilin-type processing-associated H-X9-DG protein